MPDLFDTEEWQQGAAMQPACDRVYREVFGEGVSISRTKGDRLDRRFHIDTILTLPTGAKITLQEKALSNHYSSFETFTIEYHQDRNSGEGGEFFELFAQMELHGYSDDSGEEFSVWYLVHVAALQVHIVETFSEEEIQQRLRAAGGSNADFLWLRHDEIPGFAIYAEGKGPGETTIVREVPF